MKNAIKFRTNEKVEFVVEEETYKSNVQDIVSENSIAISVPVNGAKNYLPHIGENIEFFILSQSEYYKYKGKLSNRMLEGNLRLLIIDDLKCLGKIQRRENFRIPASLSVSYIRLPEELINKNLSNKALEALDEKFVSTTSLDISAGGVKLLSSENIDEGTYMMLKINIDNEENMYIKSKVIRKEVDTSIKIYKLGCRFENIDDAHREKIVKFVFERSRELIKR